MDKYIELDFCDTFGYHFLVKADLSQKITQTGKKQFTEDEIKEVEDRILRYLTHYNGDGGKVSVAGNRIDVMGSEGSDVSVVANDVINLLTMYGVEYDANLQAFVDEDQLSISPKYLEGLAFDLGGGLEK